MQNQQDLPLTGGHSMDIPSSALPADPPKKQRQPGRRWLRFHQADRLELVEYRGKTLMKGNFCLGRAPGVPTRLVFVPPWAWVHSFRSVKGAKKRDA